MNKESVDSTEKLILEAAKKVFIEKGYGRCTNARNSGGSKY